MYFTQSSYWSRHWNCLWVAEQTKMTIICSPLQPHYNFKIINKEREGCRLLFTCARAWVGGGGGSCMNKTSLASVWSFILGGVQWQCIQDVGLCSWSSGILSRSDHAVLMFRLWPHLNHTKPVALQVGCCNAFVRAAAVCTASLLHSCYNDRAVATTNPHSRALHLQFGLKARSP